MHEDILAELQAQHGPLFKACHDKLNKVSREINSVELFLQEHFGFVDSFESEIPMTDYQGDKFKLGWLKLDSKWKRYRLCLYIPHGGGWRPLVEAPAVIRLRTFPHLKEFCLALASYTKDLVFDIEDEIEDEEDFNQ